MVESESGNSDVVLDGVSSDDPPETLPAETIEGEHGASVDENDSENVEVLGKRGTAEFDVTEEENGLKKQATGVSTLNQVGPFAVGGFYHVIFLANDGSVYGSGSNNTGEIGQNESVPYVAIPHKIENLPPVVSVSCGSNFTVCADAFGDVWTFGSSDYGQLGTGSEYSQCEPTKVPGLPAILSITCGDSFTLCLSDDTTVWGFGANDYGQLGLGHCDDVPKPEKIPIDGVCKIVCGGQHSLVVKDCGALYVCGHNDAGKLGLGHEQDQNRFIAVSDLPPIVDMAAAYWHSLILDNDGNVYGAGQNGTNELGICENPKLWKVKTWRKIPVPGKVQSVSCGSYHSMCVGTEKELYMFGNNSNRQMGNFDEVLGDVTKPILLPFFGEVDSISSGGGVSIIKNSKGIWTCGNNTTGTRGIGNLEFLPEPTKLPDEFTHIMGKPRVYSKGATNNGNE